MFYSKAALSQTDSDGSPSERRFFYGYGGLQRSTGINPRQLKMYQIDKTLDNILSRVKCGKKPEIEDWVEAVPR